MNLGADEIHLWFAEVNNFGYQDLIDSTQTWLSSNDKKRHDRYHFQEHKQQLLLGRYFVRSVLSRYEMVAEQDWQFVHNDYGKPFIDPQQQSSLSAPLYFNLSHSKGQMVLALSRHEMLGVDIEWGVKQRRVERIAERYFSSTEISDFGSLGEVQLQQRFYDLWSLKEAYIKACGLGLAIPLDQFSYRFADSNKIEISFIEDRRDTAENWQIWQLTGVPDFHLALALKSASGRVIESLGYFELLNLTDSVEKSIGISRASR